MDFIVISFLPIIKKSQMTPPTINATGISQNPPTSELLPVEETTPDTPLRVGWSPLYEEPKLAELLGIKRLWVKDDGQNPTASLKDRASAMAVAKAMEAGAMSPRSLFRVSSRQRSDHFHLQLNPVL